MPNKIVYCKSQKCGTDQIDLFRLKSDFCKVNIELIEVEDFCINHKFLSKVKDDIVFAGCSADIIKNWIIHKNMKIEFADIRELCFWKFQDREIIYKEVILEIKLALNRLKFKKKVVEFPLKSLNEQLDSYIKRISEIGANPFKF